MGKFRKRILPLTIAVLLVSAFGVLAFTDASGWLQQLPARIATGLLSDTDTPPQSSTASSASATHAITLACCTVRAPPQPGT